MVSQLCWYKGVPGVDLWKEEGAESSADENIVAKRKEDNDSPGTGITSSNKIRSKTPPMPYYIFPCLRRPRPRLGGYPRRKRTDRLPPSLVSRLCVLARSVIDSQAFWRAVLFTPICKRCLHTRTFYASPVLYRYSTTTPG